MQGVILGVLLGSVYGMLEIRYFELVPTRAQFVTSSDRIWSLFMCLKGLVAFATTYLSRAIASWLELEDSPVVAGWSLIMWSILVALYGCTT